MKQIYENKYMQSIAFGSLKELDYYLKQQPSTLEKIFINDGIYDKYYALVFCHSLIETKEFIILFGSDEDEDLQSILYWDKASLIVLNTGSRIYLINEKLEIITSFDYLSLLIGMYITTKNNLIVLGDIFVKILNMEGDIIKSESFDLIQDYSLNNDELYIKPDTGDELYIKINNL